jgi:hypothetical protein
MSAAALIADARGIAERPVTRTMLWDSAPDWGPAP